MLIKWSFKDPKIHILTNEPRKAIVFWARCTPINLFWTPNFLVSIFGCHT